MKNSLRDTQSPENDYMMRTTGTYDNLKVVIRIRPPLSREIETDLPFRSIVLVTNDKKTCNLAEYMGAELYERERQRDWVDNPNLFQLHRFTFDSVFDSESSQTEVYEQTAKPAVFSILEGYNSTIFAYGQTGTGKTYTMEGFTYNSSDIGRGIIPRSIEEIFNYIEMYSSSDTKFMVRASYLQIYNESISDLLKPDKISLQIREDKKKGVFVESLSEWAVRSPSDIYTLLQRGAGVRATACTKMNDVSSRSHAVFVITVEQMTIVDGQNGEQMTQIKVGKLNLVDLAGSERIRVTGATGKQLEESKKINKSLSALGNVIYALTDNKGRSHIPYRDSKLTRLLEDSLGGNCKTTMMAMISPAHDSFNESLSTLHFARRAKNIKNKPRINEDVDHKALIRQYEVELKKLRAELEEKNRLIHTNELVIQLEEEKKRAEEDKQAAIIALEQASKQYLQEREEKKRLELKIQMMNSQVIIGGHKIEDTPQFRSALEERQTILLKEFDQKFQEFERERQQIEEEKAQVERYKQLLLKQRDIMIALTTKLNERDETIVQLQEELDAYDKINREQEDIIEIKSNRVVLLESLLVKNNINPPDDKSKIIDKDKYNSKRNDRIYVPYEADNNSPTTLLSAEEKIRELTHILNEQEKELNIMKLVSQKFIESEKASNYNDFYKLSEKDYETKHRLDEIEKENQKLNKELEERDEILNYQKLENESLNDQLSLIAKNFEINETNNKKFQSLKDNLLSNLDKVIKRIDNENIQPRIVKNDIINIIQFILKNTDTPTNNIIEEERFEDNSKKSSYITENYQKFKQQEKDKGKSNEIDRNSINRNKSVTPNKDKRFNDNINYVKKEENRNSTYSMLNSSGKNNTVSRIKDNNFFNKFINK